MSSINIRLKLYILSHEVKVEAPSVPGGSDCLFISLRIYFGLVMLLISGQVCHLALLKTLCILIIVHYVPTFVFNIVFEAVKIRNNCCILYKAAVTCQKDRTSCDLESKKAKL